MDGFGKTRHFSSLDGLRCLCILPVVWHHATPRPLEGVLGRGPLGVHLFFAISGFLITTLLLREKDERGTISLAGFYLRRSLRIFPLYFAVLFLYAVRTWLFVADSPARDHFFDNLPFYASYTANWFVDFEVPHPVIFGFSWSLSTEEQFYLTFPFVIALARGWRAPVAVALLAFGLDFAAERGVLLAPSTLGFQVLTSISAPICLGALLGHALHFQPSRRVFSRLFGHVLSAPVAFVLLAACVAIDGIPLLLIHLAMVALVGAVCLRSDNGLAALLTLPPLRFVGKVSYGVYLFHVSVITATKAILPASLVSAPILFAIATPVTLLIAALSYRYFEGPLLSLHERFRPTSESLSPAA